MSTCASWMRSHFVHRRVQYSKPERAGIVRPPCGLGILDSAGAERRAGIRAPIVVLQPGFRDRCSIPARAATYPVDQHLKLLSYLHVQLYDTLVGLTLAAILGSHREGTVFLRVVENRLKANGVPLIASILHDNLSSMVDNLVKIGFTKIEFEFDAKETKLVWSPAVKQENVSNATQTETKTGGFAGDAPDKV